MIFDIIQISAIVVITAFSTYFLTRHLLDSEADLKHKSDLEDIGLELRRLKGIEESLDKIPKKIDLCVEKVNQHTDIATQNLKENFLKQFDEKMMSLEVVLSDTKMNTEIIDQEGLMENIETLIGQKMDTAIDRLFESKGVTSSKQYDDSEVKEHLAKLSGLIGKLTSMVELIQKSEKPNQNITLLNDKIEKT